MGADIPADRLLFLDTETRSPIDLKVHGLHRYMQAAQVTIVAFARGDEPVQSWAIRSRERLRWRDAPAPLRECWQEAAAGRRWIVAWNAAFDRLAMAAGIDGAPPLPAEAWLDAMAQATCSHLPGDLKGASEMVPGGTAKLSAGVGLIRMFATRGLWPDEAPEQWSEFIRYAERDVEATRAVWQATMPLSRRDWADYWLSERINDRGLPVDADLADRCATLADLVRADTDARVARITGGAVPRVTAVPSLRAWLADKLADDPDALACLRDAGEGDADDDDADAGGAGLTVRRSNLLALIDHLKARGGDPHVIEVAAARAWGGGTAMAKFAKVRDAALGGRIYGQYVWRGAAATGRFSSRGIQLHNLPRAAVGDLDAEMAVIDAILSRPPAEAVATIRQRAGDPAAAMTKLIRPLILAPAGRVLTWADWSAIEARVLPWIAQAGAVLDVFRASDEDPRLPDIYEVEASKALGVDPGDIDAEQRQIYGKIPVLSLGYGGGVGALGNMARNYGVDMDVEQQAWIVDTWRRANPWARDLWDEMMWAFESALRQPMKLFRAGRVGYHYLPDYHGGTVFCELPSGRPLLYPDVRLRKVVRTRRDGTKVEEVRLTARRGRGWTPIWHGLLAENATQAICADILVAALHRIEARRPGLVIGHTHDEIIGETAEGDGDAAQALLEASMSEPPEWASDLPLKVEGRTEFHYTKAKS